MVHSKPYQHIRLAIRWVAFLAFVATYVIVVWAVFRGTLDDHSQRLLWSLIGVGVSGAILDFVAAAYLDHRRGLLTAVLSLLCALVSYQAIVWGMATGPFLFRLWWISGLAALVTAHLGTLRMIHTDARASIDRYATPLAIITVVLLASLGLRSRESLLSSPSPVFTGVVATLILLNLVIVFRAWRRFVTSRVEISAVWKRSRRAVIALFVLGLFGSGFYIGRATAPPSSPADLFPSYLRGLDEEEIEKLVRKDFQRLRQVSTDIDGLADKADVFQAKIQKDFANGRTYYSPEEDSRIRQMFMSYLSYRTELLRMLAKYSGFQAVPDPDLQARCFLVGFASAVTVFENTLKLVRTFEGNPHARRKLNEPEPAWGIPAQMFDQLHRHVTSPRNHRHCTEMGAYFRHQRAAWSEAKAWEPESFDWLSDRITRGLSYVEENAIGRPAAILEQIVAQVKSDAYSPVYVCQSLVSEWIGDTRLVEREPLISIEQIDELESRLRPGDILLERRNWFLSNAFLPGFWPHAALYIGTHADLQALGITDDPEVKRRLKEYLSKAADGHDHTIIEAISEGVVFNSLHHSMHADHVAVLRPNISREDIGKAIRRAFMHEGKPYDFEFDFFTSHRLVCTEVVYRAYEGLLHFDLVEVMGRNTLPALNIARKFAEERNGENQELDFVLFLDGDTATGKAREASEDDFCKSIERPQAFQGR
jgi:hypothetical protein